MTFDEWFEKSPQNRSRMDELRAAFTAGQECMKERAAKVADCLDPRCQGCTQKRVAATIRAMPTHGRKVSRVG